MDEEAVADNPRRPSTVPWRVGLLVDWAHQTQPMLDYANAIELALEQAWQDGLIDRRVELVTRKVHGGPSASALDVRAAFCDLAYEQRVHAIIGPTLPDDLMACRHEIDRAMVPVLSFGGTLNLSSPFLFQLPNGTYADEIRMIVRHARQQGFQRVALIRDASMMGDEYAVTFNQAMRECGLHVSGTFAISPAPSQNAVNDAVKAAQLSQADALLVISVAMHRKFVQALDASGWTPGKFMVCNFVAAIPGFDGPEAFEGWVGIDQFDEANLVFNSMVDAFEKRFGRCAGHPYQAIGYDIGRTLAKALSMMAPSTPEGLRDALERVRMLPAAAGGKGTLISFAKNVRRGYQGNYLVCRTVSGGVNQVLGGLLDYLD
ncbi:ABC-type branched-chain amino acid transport system, substrate-binding protein [Pseudomonas sp. 9AZ]|uniref:ABC transporter substrate-binding protein n=1 Tax=Pseudomonas sp. 9AZ TaxID=2653168 RepID=UPI0012F0A641|nr:ABC transporter substrate-binding protein [Pseudomonas sp. 9AZ]VXD04210.1 ABC-type branched-chain amino acid transport system, substrate-binding protein [Pseudomonas sp. 9AZ]